MSEVASIFAVFQAHWWVAGGRAIELALGHEIREHGDTDVLVLRRDHLAVRRLLSRWQCWAVDPPGTLRPWSEEETLPAKVHDIWCRPTESEPWRIQVMLDESMGEDWVSRRDARIRRAISSIGLQSADQIPYLAPEIELFYKAKDPRPKDEVDFTAVLPALSGQQREWLRASIRMCFGDQHPWIERLRL